MIQRKTIKITLQDGNLPFSVEIEREYADKQTVLEFIECYHPNAILISFKEIK